MTEVETEIQSESTPTSSPLAEAVPESLDELFSRNPLDLSEADLDKIIAKYRADRGRFAQADLEGKRVPATRAKPLAKPKRVMAAGEAIDLSEIGL